MRVNSTLIHLLWVAVLLPALWLYALPEAMGAMVQSSAVYCHSGQGVPLPRHVGYVRDPGHQHDLQELRHNPGLFQPVGRNYINFGSTHDQIWLTFQVENCHASRQDLTFVLNIIRAGNLDVYKVAGGKVDHLHDSSKPGSTLKVVREFHTLAFRFFLDPREKVRFFVRLVPANDSLLPFEIKETWRHGMDQVVTQSLTTAIAAAFFTLITFNAVLFLFTQMRLFIIVVIAELGCLIYFLHVTGYTMVHVWGDGPWDMAAAGVIAVFAITMTVVFTTHYFELNQQAPGLNRVMNGLIFAGLLFIVFKPVSCMVTDLPSTTVNTLGYLVAFPSLVGGILVSSYYILVRGNGVAGGRGMALLILLAWLVLTGNMLVLAMRPLDLLPHTPYGNLYFGAGMLLEAILITCALAWRIRTLYRERESALLSVNAMQREQIAQHQREQALLKERAIADQTALETGKLMLAVGHDSRQIMAAMANYGHVLTHMFDDQRIVKIGRAIHQATEVMSDIFASTFDLGRSVQRSPQPNVTTFACSRLFATLKMIHKHGAQARGNRLLFREGELMLHGDQVMLTRILGNFIDNAIKATQNGFVYVVWRKRGDGLILQVWDNGMGIPAADLPGLLQAPIVPAELPDPNPHQGYGIGLSASAELARSFGAELSIKSLHRRGTIAEFILPYAPDYGPK
ncbi:MAG: sensor histidine kinase [Magnetococcales bacterium]|nr:sensor histidine kinase [Magnetococcales bacterium]